MIATLNALVDLIELDMSQEIDVGAFARKHGTTEYHVRRMFATLAHMPLSEYVRRRRMTLAGTDLVDSQINLLDLAVRYGYGSVEAFGRAFKSVHGCSPADVRRSGGPLHAQPMLRFSLRVEGSTSLDVTIIDQQDFVLAGYATTIPLIYEGINPHIQAHIASIPMAEHVRLKNLNDMEPSGILAITDELTSDSPEGSMLTYVHGVAVSSADLVPADLATMHLPAGTWAVFTSSGPFPDALQRLWAATATDWFPSNPWRLRPGPSILRYLELTESFATCELWLAIERE